MSATIHIQPTLDVICQHKKDGTIIPLKIRLQDEDGEYQVYKIKSYRCNNLSKVVNPKLTPVLVFECKINCFDRERLVRISYSFNDGLWKVLA